MLWDVVEILPTKMNVQACEENAFNYDATI
jgi:hypothetical protein